MEEKKESPAMTDELVANELEERKRKLKEFVKKKSEWIFYGILVVIAFLSVYIRTLNIPKLKDITNGEWTLGPDLDPFLFLRWAKDIVENGSLMIYDSMRYVPLGYDTSGEMKLLSYMIAWFHKANTFFSPDASVTYSAILFPAIMFGLTVIAFFLFARKIFYKEDVKTKNIIALIATAFFVFIPSLLSRTIAGIPEKESVAFLFMFISLYFFMEAMTSEKLKKGLVFGILAGITTALMALVWGGVIYLYFIITPAILIAFIFGKIKKKEAIIYSSWLLSSFIVSMPFSTRYTLKNLITSLSTGFALGVLILIVISLFLMKNEKIKKIKLPHEISSLIISIIILIILISVILGPNFIINQIIGIKTSLITPLSDRFGLTVAENKQPYFLGDWSGSFGPIKFGIPLYFWLFISGSVLLFNNLIKDLKKKEKVYLTLSYLIFLLFLILSRYSPSSSFNGVSGISLLVYFSGWVLFIFTLGYVYYQRYKINEHNIFKEFNFTYLLYFLAVTIGITGARAAVRLIMVLGAVSPVAVSFLIVKSVKGYFKEKEESMKLLTGFLAIIVLIAGIFTFSAYYKEVKTSAEYYAPGPYQFQWQKTMSWVRENTSNNAVFAHWWDYGYWVQSIGERATILDGGNAYAYWNHMMGRYVLTGTENNEALEYLYTHNGTHLLIDSTEIGKYTAYSSIGSDKDYDRFSWITTYLMDSSKTYETKNESVFTYYGGSISDEDIIWKDGNKEIFLPKKRAGIGAIIIKKDKDGKILQPEAIFVDNGKQYVIPLKYIYINNELKEFEKGLNAGIFVFPSLDQMQDGRVKINNEGALLYLSRRTIHSNLANLYLFNKKSEYFKLVHSEDNFVTENLRSQGLNASEFIYYQGFQGPIKIWEIKYPKNIKSNPDYLKTDYPEELKFAKKGEY